MTARGPDRLPGVITPQEGLERIHARFGAHPGHRALHAKGVIYTATYTATPAAAKLTRAGHMAGTPAGVNWLISL